jgi:ankyrin repeat protein
MSVISKLRSPSAWHDVGGKQMSLLMHAAQEPNVTAYELLLFKGADPTKVNVQGDSIMSYLVGKKGLTTRWGDLCLGYLDAADKKAFVNHGGRGSGELERELGVFSCSKNVSLGWTPLMSAADAGRIDWVKWLVQHGANVEAKMCSTGWTACHSASKGGHGRILEFLLENGGEKEATATHRDYGRLLTVADVAKEGSDVLDVLSKY